ncbi:hypothetical protein LWI28_026406 [Acer negundo]|uniref:Uncharacterized protein n=1 Tax=Acer negundo TaxID=4023 RepID=A0AAD5IWR6_ACENE|nr:hypothetical protein LWI28_026406 [Acer negundo]
MAMVASNLTTYHKAQIICRKKEKEIQPYKVIEITPPPKSLGVRCFSSNLQCGESVTIEGQTYTIRAVTHRYQLRKGKYEPRASFTIFALLDRLLLPLHCSVSSMISVLVLSF